MGEENGYFGIRTVSADGKVSFEPYGRCVYINHIIEIHETREVLMDLEYDYSGRAVRITLPRGEYYGSEEPCFRRESATFTVEVELPVREK